jgi:hypothetical protein
MYYSFPAFARLAAREQTLAADEVKPEEVDAARDEQPAAAPASGPLPVTALE